MEEVEEEKRRRRPMGRWRRRREEETDGEVEEVEEKERGGGGLEKRRRSRRRFLEVYPRIKALCRGYCLFMLLLLLFSSHGWVGSTYQGAPSLPDRKSPSGCVVFGIRLFSVNMWGCGLSVGV